MPLRGRPSLWRRLTAAAAGLILAGSAGGVAAAAPAALPLSPPAVAALGPLTPWQVQWLETGGASGVPGPTAPVRGGAPMHVVTMVSTFAPAGFDATSTVSGSCWTGSIAAPRAGAYRCSVGNGILDPCFRLAGGASVACPTGDPGAQQGTVIRLTKPLPAGNTARPSPRHPWYFTLLGGGACGAMTGTLVSAHDPYGCLVPASAAAPQRSLYCTAPAAVGEAYTVDCAPLASTPAPDGAPQLAAASTYPITHMWL